jgi:hypothetical protein
MSDTKPTSISFPRMVINVDLVGDFSLAGALAEKLIKARLMKHVGILHPEEIVFVIGRVQPGVNLYKELNSVRDIFKIDEKKITLFIKT